MITFIESGNRIATENFEIGEIYTITFTNGNYKTMCCVGIGSDFVMFQDKLPNALFCLTLGTSETVSTIELGGGGSGTMNYNELENKPQINGVVLIGNKTASDLNLVLQNDLADYVTDTELSTELADYATTASVVSALASKQDTLSTPQLTAVNSGITSSLVTQITTNKNNILTVSNQSTKYNLSPVASGTASGAGFIIANTAANIPQGDYYFCWTGTANTYGTTINIYQQDGTRIVNQLESNSAGEMIIPVNVPADGAKFNLYTTVANNITNLRIIPKNVYDSGFTAYQPYAMSNAEITAWILSHT